MIIIVGYVLFALYNDNKHVQLKASLSFKYLENFVIRTMKDIIVDHYDGGDSFIEFYLRDSIKSKNKTLKSLLKSKGASVRNLELLYIEDRFMTETPMIKDLLIQYEKASTIFEEDFNNIYFIENREELKKLNETTDIST